MRCITEKIGKMIEKNLVHSGSIFRSMNYVLVIYPSQCALLVGDASSEVVAITNNLHSCSLVPADYHSFGVSRKYVATTVVKYGTQNCILVEIPCKKKKAGCVFR